MKLDKERGKKTKVEDRRGENPFVRAYKNYRNSSLRVVQTVGNLGKRLLTSEGEPADNPLAQGVRKFRERRAAKRKARIAEMKEGKKI